MPSLRVVSGSSLLVVGVMSAIAFAGDLPDPFSAEQGLLASARITTPVGVENEKFEAPSATALADLTTYKTRTVVDTLVVLEEPRDVKTQAKVEATDSAVSVSPAKLALTSGSPVESATISESGIGSSVRVASAGTSPVTVSVIGAAALALVGGAAAVISRSRKISH